MWSEYFTKIWNKDADLLLIYKIVLENSCLSNIKELLLNKYLMETLKINYVAVYYEYGPINKTIFNSAAIGSIFHLSSSLRHYHIIMGECQGEGYPLAALFVP